MSSDQLRPLPPKPLHLAYRLLKHTFLIPSSVYIYVLHQRDEFIVTLPAITVEHSQDDEPSSTEELVALFLSYIVQGQHWEGLEHDHIGREALLLLFNSFETSFLQEDEIHALVATLPGNRSKRLAVVQAYYEAHHALYGVMKPCEPNLLRAAQDGDARIYAIFGGQGIKEDYFGELKEMYFTYRPFVRDLLLWGSEVLRELSEDSRTGNTYLKGLDPFQWLQNPDEEPDIDYLISAPVSFPLIGLLQLLQFSLTCRLLGFSPGRLRESLVGVSGHSQGIITAVVVSIMDTWESFHTQARIGLTMLFWIGLRSQEAYPQTAMTPSLLQESAKNGEGTPTPMLGVRYLARQALQQHIDATNSHLPLNKHVHLSLTNGANNHVLSGPPRSLCGLNSCLRQMKAPTGLDQTRVPFSKRKPYFANVFLPTTAPFHSPYLLSAYHQILNDLCDVHISGKSLKVPVYRTDNGHDLQSADDEDLVPALVQMITCIPVDWEIATSFRGATHALDFGPGGSSGIGLITHQNKEGSGIRIISSSSIGERRGTLGSKEELFDCNRGHPVRFAANWRSQYGPRLAKTAAGQTILDTKFSRLLGLPPVMVAGMTPCTVPWDFVAATMNAGYHIELAGGGYYTPQAMKEAIHKIAKAITPGRAVTINIIYASPTTVAWQILLIRQLSVEGIQVDGLVVGAGIPTPDVANDYITSLGLRHISFKPSSAETIQQVIAIAKSHENFPIILQWTGGRGGGHHSYEDFHQPILEMYGKIRECSNIILVAGSGFGGGEDTYPYLTGTWTAPFRRPFMPFDGILLGSRMMTAKEAHTSRAAKQAIVDTKGVSNAQWESSYDSSAGGIMTVQSEMGEPIHKLATRGVRFWAEMDRKIFVLEKSKRVSELKKKREYIIQKLNDDFQKVWFGKNTAGESVDIEDMTYFEVLRRMIDLLYIKHELRWIDTSYKVLVGDFIRRVEERYMSQSKPSMVQNYSDMHSPYLLIERVLSLYPECGRQLVNTQDVEHFLLLCQSRGQKPVPFIPALDENFETWFKKDSLWQSEDIEAVIDQDVGRTCILQGPVAVRYSCIVDEAVKDILDNICAVHVERLTDETYGSETKIPQLQQVDAEPTNQCSKNLLDGLTLTSRENTVIYTLSSSTTTPLPALDRWLRLLAGDSSSWRYAFFTSDTIIQKGKIAENPIKRIFLPNRGTSVEIVYPNEPRRTVIKVREQTHRKGIHLDIIEVKATSERDICLTLYESRSANQESIGLDLDFSYHPEANFAPIREIMEGRIDRIKGFYYRLWFGDEEMPLDATLADCFQGDITLVDRRAVNAFLRAIGSMGEAYVDKYRSDFYAPMDFAIKAAWKAMVKPLFIRSLDGDLTRLVHLYNRFRMLNGTKSLKIGDVLETTSRISAVINQDSGKMVEICGTITKEGIPIMEVISRFLYRGKFSDYKNTFQRKTEPPIKLNLRTEKDVTRLKSRQWFCPEIPRLDLLNTTITFHLESMIHYESKDVFSSVEVTGQVFSDSSTSEVLKIAQINYHAGHSHGNPVIDYLERHGSQIEQRHIFDTAIPMSDTTPHPVHVPASNEVYAEASGDYNPIHVSRVFSRYANLVEPITHGMYTSAIVRGFVETLAADSEVERVKSFSCFFVGTVLPNDHLIVKLWHIGMISGRKIIKAEATTVSGDMVLEGEAEVEQPVSAYVFTGQGSQHKGMGMDLYSQNEVARAVWDHADAYFVEHFGFSILNIIRENPKELIIHFGGQRGRAVRQNYMKMAVESVGPDGQIVRQQIFKEIDANTTSYTHRSPQGLLFTTQFAQPALTLMAKANFSVLQARGLVQEQSTYAGHSLGEYAALSSFSDFMSIEDLAILVFYRGLLMQDCVERDTSGRTNYAMCAINPSRVSSDFDEKALRDIVQSIQQETNWLLEIVNLNISNLQYTCTGDLRALDVLTSITNYLNTHPTEISSYTKTSSPDCTKLIHTCAAQTREKSLPLELARGVASTPLYGIDVPFHSTFLRPGVPSFRSVLRKNIQIEAVDPLKLVNSYIPNLVGKPFEITKPYFEEVGRLTGSSEINRILNEVRISSHSVPRILSGI